MRFAAGLIVGALAYPLGAFAGWVIVHTNTRTELEGR